MPKESLPRSKSGRIMDYLANRSNVGRPFRAIKNLMDDPPSLTGPIRKEDIERSFDAAGLASAGSMAGKRPRNSVGTGGRPFKVSGASSQVKVNQPKPGTSKFVGPVKPKATRKAKTESAPADTPSSSARYKVSGSQQGYTGPKPKPGSQKFIGPTRATQPGEKGFVGPINKPKSGDSKFIGPSQPPRSSGGGGPIGPQRPPRSGDSDFVGPVKPSPEKKGMSTAKKVGIAGAATGAITAGYLGTRDGSSKSGAKTTIANRKEYQGSNTGNRKTFGGARPETLGSYPSKAKVYGGARPETPGSYQAERSKSSKADKIPKPKPKPDRKAAGAASDKSRLTPKMTAFQRQKARQFEKEGVAGRSMTAAQAKRKASEKGSNVAGLRSLFGLSKAKSAAPNKAKKPSGPLKSAFAQISLQGRKKK